MQWTLLISSKLSIQESLHHYRKITLLKYRETSISALVNLENRLHTHSPLHRIAGICSQYCCHDFCITMYEFLHMNLHSACYIMTQDVLYQDFYLPPECCTRARAGCSREEILIPNTLYYLHRVTESLLLFT